MTIDASFKFLGDMRKYAEGEPGDKKINMTPDVAVIGMVLSYYIRELGYDARNHMDGNYLVLAPLAAKDAGLGHIGRNGILITKEFGPRVRLTVVTSMHGIRPFVKGNAEWLK